MAMRYSIQQYRGGAHIDGVQMQLSSSVQIRRTCTLRLLEGVPAPTISDTPRSSASHQHFLYVRGESACITQSRGEDAHRRLPPEEQQLLCCRELGRVDVDLGRAVPSLERVKINGCVGIRRDWRLRYARLERDQRNGRDAAPVGLHRAVAPLVVALKAAVTHTSARVAEAGGWNAPHAQHIDEMLFGDIVLPVDVPLERRKDALPVEELPPALRLERHQGWVGVAVLVRCWAIWTLCSSLFRWDGKELELFPQDNDGLLVEERVLVLDVHALRGGCLGDLALLAEGRAGCAVEVVCSGSVS